MRFRGFRKELTSTSVSAPLGSSTTPSLPHLRRRSSSLSKSVLSLSLSPSAPSLTNTSFFSLLLHSTLTPTAALKLSLLFPSLVLSLSLIGLGSLFSLPKNREAFAELDAAWKGPEDEDDFYDALDALTQFFLHDWGKDGADPLRDEVAGAMCRVSFRSDVMRSRRKGTS